MLWDLISRYNSQAWLILGIVLLALEMLIPGSFLLWFAFGAMATALLVVFFPLAVWVQLIIFSVLSLIGLLFFRTLLVDLLKGEAEADNLHDRVQSLIGEEYSLARPIKNGRGVLRVGDSDWRCKGPDLEAGTKVRVKGAKGSLLIVEKLE